MPNDKLVFIVTEIVEYRVEATSEEQAVAIIRECRERDDYFHALVDRTAEEEERPDDESAEADDDEAYAFNNAADIKQGTTEELQARADVLTKIYDDASALGRDAHEAVRQAQKFDAELSEIRAELQRREDVEMVDCPDCGGDGYEPGRGKSMSCGNCEGTGRVPLVVDED